jgi:hypothetical protein
MDQQGATLYLIMLEDYKSASWSAIRLFNHKKDKSCTFCLV